MPPRPSSNNYISGSIGGTMLKTAVAMLPGTLAISGYNLADTYFVGKLGTDPLAAMGYTFPVIMLVNCLFHGLSVGVMTTSAQAVGGNKHDKASKLISAGMLLIFLLAILIGVIGVCTIEPTFRNFGAGSEVMTLIRDYMCIWYLGCATAALATTGNSLLIAVGDAALASTMMVSGMLLNVVLDPLFIFGWGVIPGMGMRGAALATVFSQLMGALFMLMVLHWKHHLLNFQALQWRLLRRVWALVLRFALPASLGMILMPLGNAVTTRILATFGDVAVAAAAAAGRLEMVAFIFPMALGISLLPMIGQNFGAKFYRRIDGCRSFSMRFAFFFELGMMLLFLLFAPHLTGFFTQDPEVARIMVIYLRIIPFGFGLMEIHRYAGFFFTGCGHPAAAAWLNALRIVGLLIPLSLLALLLKDSLGISGVFAARLIADVVAGSIGVLLVRRLTNRFPTDGMLISNSSNQRNSTSEPELRPPFRSTTLAEANVESQQRAIPEKH